MSMPARFVPVTVYHILRPTRSRAGIRLRCKKLGVVAIATRGEFGKREGLPAEAWVKCVGIQRRLALIELNAPDVVVRWWNVTVKTPAASRRRSYHSDISSSLQTAGRLLGCAFSNHVRYRFEQQTPYCPGWYGTAHLISNG